MRYIVRARYLSHQGLRCILVYFSLCISAVVDLGSEIRSIFALQHHLGAPFLQHFVPENVDSQVVDEVNDLNSTK